jgi:hypothetical protein
MKTKRSEWMNDPASQAQKRLIRLRYGHNKPLDGLTKLEARQLIDNAPPTANQVRYARQLVTKHDIDMSDVDFTTHSGVSKIIESATGRR